MSEGRDGEGEKGGAKAPANDMPVASNRTTAAHMATSPAFDRWLEQQMKMLFAAAESPPDERLLELIRQAFPNGQDKVTK